MSTKKVLAAIMFTDITGFSAMMQSSEHRATLVRNRHRSVFKDAHSRYGGKILQYFGDGTLSIFESVSAAVECAVEMQIEFRKEPEVPLRIGIHTGDIAYDEEGAYGNSMNIASRVENLAVPGSIFITGKVYDDIKNHSWLAAIFLGSFKLRNIFHNVELYSVSSKGVRVPEVDELAVMPEYEQKENVEKTKVGNFSGTVRKKRTAAFLAFFFGVFGVHRFYLGQRGKGIAMLVCFLVAMFITVGSEIPFVGILAIIAFVDSLVLGFMPKIEFHNRYNTQLNNEVPKSKKKKKQSTRSKPTSRVREDPTKKLFDAAVREYKKGRYNKAIEQFDLVLNKRPDDYLAHFYLARIFSLMYDKNDSFFHLEQSVKYGFDDFEWLEQDPALDHLRAQYDYAGFRKNGYRKVIELPEPEPKPDLLDNLQKNSHNNFEKIELLGDQMEKGEISRAQFEIEKKKLLGG